MNHALDVSSRHVVCFQVVARDGMQAGFVCFDEAWHDDAGWNVSDSHEEELNQRDFHSRHFGGEPEEERHEVKEDAQENDGAKDEGSHN